MTNARHATVENSLKNEQERQSQGNKLKIDIPDSGGLVAVCVSCTGGAKKTLQKPSLCQSERLTIHIMTHVPVIYRVVLLLCVCVYVPGPELLET